MVDLNVQNKALMAKIQALKSEVGLANVTKMERVKKAFLEATKTTDSDGLMGIEDFKLLAFDSGASICTLTQEHVKESFEEAIVKGKGEFLAFYKWLVLKGMQKTKEGTFTLEAMKLKARLHAKGFVSTLAKLRAQGGGNGQSVKKIHTPDKNQRSIRFGLSIGEFETAKAGVYIKMGRDHKKAEKTRSALKLKAENGRCVFFLDVPIKPGASAETIESIQKTIQKMIQEATLKDLAGFPVISGRSAEVIKREDGVTCLRVAFFSDVDPIKAVEAATSKDRPQDNKNNSGEMGLISLLLQDRDQAFVQGDVKVEFPISLVDLESKGSLSPEDIKMKFALELSVAPELISASRNLLETFGRRIPSEVAGFHSKLIMIGFCRQGSVDLKFANPGEFFAWLPEKNNSQLDEVKAKASAMLDQVLKSPVEAARNLLSSKGVGVLELLPAVAKKIYSALRKHSSGLDGARVHFQLDDFVVSFDFMGLDLTLIAPDIAV
mmetsp:Transcript_32598/g.52966  ORF Transcript_32598/g.52966 Transcript_32598/m.52966 type:complete len:493 (-) Transcript_32598:119-1597(-)